MKGNFDSPIWSDIVVTILAHVPNVKKNGSYAFHAEAQTRGGNEKIVFIV